MNNLGVHHLTAMEVDPVEFIEIAARAGAGEVSLFISQIGLQGDFPVVTAELLGPVRKKLGDTGLCVANMDPLALTPQTRVADYRPAIERAAELGARRVNALLFDPDESRLGDALAELCADARTHSLGVGIEFLALTPAWNTLEEALRLVERLGQPNLAVGIDVLHLVRSGGGPASIAAADPARIGYVQLCDGAGLQVTTDYVAEATGNRLAPGEGVFPLREILQALPVTANLELEVPQRPDRPAPERVRHVVAAAQQVLSQTGLDHWR